MLCCVGVALSCGCQVFYINNSTGDRAEDLDMLDTMHTAALDLGGAVSILMHEKTAVETKAEATQEQVVSALDDLFQDYHGSQTAQEQVVSVLDEFFQGAELDAGPVSPGPLEALGAVLAAAKSPSSSEQDDTTGFGEALAAADEMTAVPEQAGDLEQDISRGYSHAASTKLRVTTNQRIRPGVSPKLARPVADCLKGLTKQEQQAAFLKRSGSSLSPEQQQGVIEKQEQALERAKQSATTTVRKKQAQRKQHGNEAIDPDENLKLMIASQC